MPGQNEGADAHHSGVRHEEPHQHGHRLSPLRRPADGATADGTTGLALDDSRGVDGIPGIDGALGIDGVIGALDLRGTHDAAAVGVAGGPVGTDPLLCPTCSAPLATGSHRPTDGAGLPTGGTTPCSPP
ncbi:hypothetical protein ACFQ0M_19240 [Kitasatospora aburaviensis]